MSSRSAQKEVIQKQKLVIAKLQREQEQLLHRSKKAITGTYLGVGVLLVYAAGMAWFILAH